MSYYDKLYSLNDDKLHEESRRLNDLLWKTPERSPIYTQLLDMIDLANQVRSERMFMAMHRESEKQPNDIIELGSIVESVYTPDYSSEELLNVVVTLYMDKPK